MDANVNKKVTVLMSVYNGEKYLREAMKSILNQTFREFEFLIIDDGSTDKSAEIIKSCKDERIKYIPNEKNMGLVYSLNRGFDLAKGKYIARMDCDDIAMPRRLEKQVAFMDRHPEISICGTWVKTFGGGKKEHVHRYFTNPDDIRASLLFNTSLAHPTVVIRTSDVRTHDLRYDPDTPHFEDYSLWVRISEYGKLANLPNVLYMYRIHTGSVSNTHSHAQKNGASLVRKSQLEKLGINPDEEEMRLHDSLCPKKNENLKEFLKKEMVWLKRMADVNKKKNVYKPESLTKIIRARWWLICRANAKKSQFLMCIKTYISYFL